MKSIETEFDEFFNSSLKNSWINDSNLKIYVRKSRRCINHQMVDVIDIANIISMKNKGKGFFKKFLLHVESYQYPIYIESIQNPKLSEMLLKHGFEFINSSADYPNMCKFC